MPWGAIGTADMPHAYNKKEWNNTYDLQEYDSKARQYYPAMMRTITQDPLAEQYYDTSPYAWCANNPVRMVDEDGKVISENDYNEHIVPLVDEILKRIQQYIDNSNYEMVVELQKTLSDIKMMRNDADINYHFMYSNDGTSYSTEIIENSKLIGLNIYYQQFDYGVLVHEIRHGGQYARREIAQGYSGYNVFSEIDAYRAQAAFLNDFCFMSPSALYLNEYEESVRFRQITDIVRQIRTLDEITPEVINALLIKKGKTHIYAYPPKNISKKRWNRKQ